MKLLLIPMLLLVITTACAQEYLKIGDECYKNKDYTCAYENYIKGHEAGLKAVKDILFFRIGYCLRQMNKHEEAKRWQYLSLAEKISGPAYWELGIDHYVTKKYDSATQYYAKAYDNITDENNRLEIAYWNAYAYYNLSRYKDARAWIDSCLIYDDEGADVYLLSGEIAAKEKNYSLAESEYKEVLALTRDSFLLQDALNGIGHLKYQQKLYLEAIPYYRSAKRYGPDETNPWAYIGDSYRMVDLVDSAEHYYKLVIDGQVARSGKIDSVYIARVAGVAIAKRLQMKDTAKAALLMPILLRYNARHADAYTYLEMLFARKDIKTLEAALPAYLAARYPRGGLLTLPAQEAGYLNRMGNLYRDAKQNQQAIRSYHTAYSLHPGDATPFASMLRIMLDEKKYKEVADSIQLKLPQIPAAQRIPVWLVQAELAGVKKDTAAAAAIYRDVVKNSPSYSPNYTAQFYLGQMALQRKDTVQCLFYWEKIAAYSGEKKEMVQQVCAFVGVSRFMTAIDAAGYRTAAGYLERAIAIDSSQPATRAYAAFSHINSSQFTSAKRHLTRLIAPYQKKKDTLALLYRALGFIEMKASATPNFATALPYYLEAQKANPKDSSVTLDLGTLYYEQKEYGKAAATFALYAGQVKARANRAAAHYNQAFCYYMNKQNTEAKEQVNKSLEIAPEYEDAKKLKAELEKPAG